ncbi:MAG TPA: hypothetical protein VFI57_00900 [Pyrinomonadaceae bacterium]|jgi:hypothetical protein|nr:hypothetical protein [Pyrinomonadaceae bacterium]
MKFARRVFLIAGIYGLLVLLPLYFLEEKTGRDDPPPITHPEYYYGFVGVAAAWQILLLIISRDPVRFRPMMIPPILAKGSFVAAVTILFLQARVSATMFGASMVDLLLAILFVIAYLKTSDAT